MTTNTYFFLHHDGTVYRKDVPVDEESPLSRAGLKIATESNQIIVMTRFGKGISIKNRLNEKMQFFSKQDMVMLSLAAKAI